MLNLKRLRSKIIGLAASYRHGGVWSRYPSNSPYDPGAEKAKKLLVADFLGRAKPATVLDLGCNTGDFSMIAAESGECSPWTPTTTRSTSSTAEYSRPL